MRVFCYFRIDFRRIFVGWIFDRLLIDSQQVFDRFAIDVRRMDYRCSIDVRWKCPSFLPSFLPSFFLPVLLRPLHFLCSVCASLVHRLDFRFVRRKAASRVQPRHFEALRGFECLSKVYRKSLQSLSNLYRISIESLSNLYRNSFAERLETGDRCLLDRSIFISQHTASRESEEIHL